MPRDDGKGKGKDEEDKTLKWMDAFVLYIENKVWAQNVYDALYTAPPFRLIVKETGRDKVLRRVPEADTDVHDPVTHKVLWKTKDVEWDDHGCLRVVDPPLSKRVSDAHDNELFDIAIPGADGPITENKVNAMCPC